jgi:hypothetical protein
MKKNLITLTTVSTLFAILLFSCQKDSSPPAAKTAAVLPPITHFSLASLGQGAFNLWGTCNGHPYDISGTNGIAIPLGNCSTDIDAAQEANGQNATGFQFNGAFKGGTSANSSASEEAVFMADNVTQWNGDEMGFVKTLNDNALKAYLQGGGNYITRVISIGDNGYHTYKAQCRSSSNVTMVDFYIDGAYNCTLTNGSGHYWNNFDYFVGTNHWYGGSSNTGQQIEMYNMVTY